MAMSTILSEFYRTPVLSRVTYTCDDAKNGTGFFSFGSDIVCYGKSSSGASPDVVTSGDFDAKKAMSANGSEIQLPFNISGAIDNLRSERYVEQLRSGRWGLTSHPLTRESYYFVRTLLPVWFRRHLQRAYFKNWQSIPFPHWPVDFTVDSLHEEFLQLMMRAHGCAEVPFIWFWPEGASGSLTPPP